ncbi:hypothetical protein RB2654_22923 [Rhodobacterales bacterium HTCC2654]|uniref:Uncharacterized protein n=1 Tax=Maritimibacter alkaliphilus HTCC2654 TaxID=314271 RepID=A3VKV1_9RHOB|nr:hypothetical protein RB2654_22923 [Rhodobacterales bacterium HTCC2654] [Maritimibacter alkaliphilus HTCC2654]
MARIEIGWHSTEDTCFIVEAGLMVQKTMAQFMCGRKSLDTHGALSGDENPLRWGIKICSEQAVERPEEQRHVKFIDESKNVD